MGGRKNEALAREVDRAVARIRRAERERPTLLAQTVYLGSLGLVFVLPVVAGAYLGRWLDGMTEGYSVRWTVSLLLLGLAVGTVNVYLMIRER